MGIGIGMPLRRPPDHDSPAKRSLAAAQETIALHRPRYASHPFHEKKSPTPQINESNEMQLQ
jgi:hypothetical protein